MWEFIKRTGFILSLIGGAVIWLSSNSLPATLVTADSHLVENLRRLGWKHPPSALASNAADHWGVLIGVLLVIFGIAAFGVWLIEYRSPLKIARLEEAPDTPNQGNIALWLIIRNRSRRRVEDVLATLTRIDPVVPAFPNQALPPFPLSTKSRLEDHRQGGQPLYQGGFTLRAGCAKPVEVAWFPGRNVLQWHVARVIGDADFLLDQTYILTVEVGGGPRPVTARIELALTDFERGTWEARLR